jgi:hypothetical protein
MSLKALQRALTLYGGPTLLAKELGVTRQTIWNWQQSEVSRLGERLIEDAIAKKRDDA